MESWPAMRKWDDDYLCEKFGERKISINVTPNGRGDAVKDGFFVMPEERSMTLRVACPCSCHRRAPCDLISDEVDGVAEFRLSDGGVSLRRRQDQFKQGGDKPGK
eukprot:1278828-Rhodomonas_salina.1